MESFFVRFPYFSISFSLSYLALRKKQKTIFLRKTKKKLLESKANFVKSLSSI